MSKEVIKESKIIELDIISDSIDISKCSKLKVNGKIFVAEQKLSTREPVFTRDRLIMIEALLQNYRHISGGLTQEFRDFLDEISKLLE